MDPELQRVHDNVRRIIDAGGPERDILAYLKSEGFDSREAWLETLNPPTRPRPIPRSEIPPEQASIGPSGPTAQPPGLRLPPLVGGALDALTAYGNSLAQGVPALLSERVGDVVESAQERNPRATLAMTAAGGATAGVGVGLGLARGAFGSTAARAVSPSGFAVTGPHLGQQLWNAARAAGRFTGSTVTSPLRLLRMIAAGR